MKYEDVIEYANEAEIDLVVFENPSYKNSIIGISYDDRVIYDMDLMIKDLIKEENLSYEDALEFIEYNTLRALPYYENSPIVLYTKEI